MVLCGIFPAGTWVIARYFHGPDGRSIGWFLALTQLSIGLVVLPLVLSILVVPFIVWKHMRDEGEPGNLPGILSMGAMASLFIPVEAVSETPPLVASGGFVALWIAAVLVVGACFSGALALGWKEPSRKAKIQLGLLASPLVLMAASCAVSLIWMTFQYFAEPQPSLWAKIGVGVFNAVYSIVLLSAPTVGATFLKSENQQ
jgi:ABC-type transport system involved in multi-copper enzyme maturation permease subunit